MEMKKTPLSRTKRQSVKRVKTEEIRTVTFKNDVINAKYMEEQNTPRSKEEIEEVRDIVMPSPRKPPIKSKEVDEMAHYLDKLEQLNRDMNDLLIRVSDFEEEKTAVLKEVKEVDPIFEQTDIRYNKVIQKIEQCEEIKKDIEGTAVKEEQRSRFDISAIEHDNEQLELTFDKILNEMNIFKKKDEEEPVPIVNEKELEPIVNEKEPVSIVNVVEEKSEIDLKVFEDALFHKLKELTGKTESKPEQPILTDNTVTPEREIEQHIPAHEETDLDMVKKLIESTRKDIDFMNLRQSEITIQQPSVQDHSPDQPITFSPQKVIGNKIEKHTKLNLSKPSGRTHDFHKNWM